VPGLERESVQPREDARLLLELLLSALYWAIVVVHGDDEDSDVGNYENGDEERNVFPPTTPVVF